MLARRSLTPLLAASLLLAVAGTAGTLDGANAADRATSAPTATPGTTAGTAPVLTSAAAGATAWKPGTPVQVTVTGGTLVSAGLSRTDGTPVRGTLKPTSWASTGTLVPRTTYVLDATAVCWTCGRPPDGGRSRS